MPKGRRAITGEPFGDVLRIRLSDEQRQQLDAAALAAGKATSTWARDELLRLAEQQQPKKPAKKRPKA